MKSSYWSARDNELVVQFYYCYTAATSAHTRQSIFNTLMPQFNYMIGTAQQMIMSSWSKEDKEEAKQDVLMKIWQVLSHKFDKDKMHTDNYSPNTNGILNFLWTVVKNKLISVTREHNRCKPDIRYESELQQSIMSDYEINERRLDYYDEDDDDDKYSDIEDMKAEIYKEIDRKILEQEKVNRTNTIYLILLKEYLIANDCNGKGFQEYICEKLGIDRKYYYQVNYKLKIRSHVFKDKRSKAAPSQNIERESDTTPPNAL